MLVTITVPIRQNKVIIYRPSAGEVVRPGLAITPVMHEGALGGFTGAFTLTHIESGYTIHSRGGACLTCVRAGYHAMLRGREEANLRVSVLSMGRFWRANLDTPKIHVPRTVTVDPGEYL